MARTPRRKPTFAKSPASDDEEAPIRAGERTDRVSIRPDQRPGAVRRDLWWWAAGSSAVLAITIETPVAMDEASGPCVALERRAIIATMRRHDPTAMRNTITRAFVTGMTTGEIAAVVAKE